MIFDYSASWNIFEVHREEEARRVLIKCIVDYYFDGRRDRYRSRYLYEFNAISPGKIWNGGKKASRGKIAFRTGIDARFLVYSKLNYSTRKEIFERRNAF